MTARKATNPVAARPADAVLAAVAGRPPAARPPVTADNGAKIVKET